MKRFLVFSLLSILMITGCGNNTKTLTCTQFNTGNNMNAEGKIEYTFKNNKLSKSRIDATFKDITVDNLSTLWSSLKEQFTDQNKPIEENGFKRTVKADDKNYTFTVTMEIDYEKISKETMEKYGIEDYTIKTYEEIKKLTTSDGNTKCE